MFTHQRLLIRFEILAIISICVLLFVVAFREAGHSVAVYPRDDAVLSLWDDVRLRTRCGTVLVKLLILPVNPSELLCKLGSDEQKLWGGEEWVIW